VDFQAKVDRANELVKIITDAEAELTALFGGERPKRKWTRRTPATEPAPTASV
jgi:hypothetical protein